MLEKSSCVIGWVEIKEKCLRVNDCGVYVWLWGSDWGWGSIWFCFVREIALENNDIKNGVVECGIIQFYWKC